MGISFLNRWTTAACTTGQGAVIPLIHKPSSATHCIHSTVLKKCILQKLLSNRSTSLARWIAHTVLEGKKPPHAYIWLDHVRATSVLHFAAHLSLLISPNGEKVHLLNEGFLMRGQGSLYAVAYKNFFSSAPGRRCLNLLHTGGWTETVWQWQTAVLPIGFSNFTLLE